MLLEIIAALDRPFIPGTIEAPVRSERLSPVCEKLYMEALSDLEDVYPDGLRAFLRLFHPEVFSEIDDANREVFSSFENDPTLFKKSLERWMKAVQKGIEIHKRHEGAQS
jgi:hypothetical protein